jgi:HPt (histidine-containing phosphotransfer) domain-containing protein
MKGENEKYQEAGMNGYLPKPFSQQDLVAVINLVLDQTLEVNSGGEDKEEGPGAAPLFQLDPIEKIAMGDKAFVQKMMDLFLFQTPAILLEMKLALEQGDLKSVSDLAHKMKPSLDIYGIISLHDVVRDLEKCGEKGLSIPEIQGLLFQMEGTLIKVFEGLKEKMDSY